MTSQSFNSVEQQRRAEETQACSLDAELVSTCNRGLRRTTTFTSIWSFTSDHGDGTGTACSTDSASTTSSVASDVEGEVFTDGGEGEQASVRADDDTKQAAIIATRIPALPHSTRMPVPVHSLAGHGSSVSQFVAHTIATGSVDASFLVTDLSSIERQVQAWHYELPMVEPFYAVKCNPAPVIVELLGHHGVNFDCATEGEIELVTQHLGFSADRVVYANPAKMPAHLRYAHACGVRLTVFDSEDELHKLANLARGLSRAPREQMQLLLRLATDDSSSVCQFSNKFGASVVDAEHLLTVARDLGLSVAGVSFHVGSGCGDAHAYTLALQHSAHVFKLATKLDMPPLHIVDIGGGFPGGMDGYGGTGMPTFSELARCIRDGIAAFDGLICDTTNTHPHAHTAPPVRFIAEPGRFFVSAATTAVTSVYARKGLCSPVAPSDVVTAGETEEQDLDKEQQQDGVQMQEQQALYVDDGVYGTFNNIIYDHASPTARKVHLPSAAAATATGAALIPTAVFGPTCDGLDQLRKIEDTLLPHCAIGDWLEWSDMGAYTHTASFVFNGYTHVPSVFYVA